MNSINFFPHSLEVLYEEIEQLTNKNSPEEIKSGTEKIEKLLTLFSAKMEGKELPQREVTSSLAIIGLHKFNPAVEKLDGKLKEKFSAVISSLESCARSKNLATCETAPVEEKPGGEEIYLNLFLGCDLDEVDHNGAIFSGCIRCLENEIPILTTSSVLFSKNIANLSLRQSNVEKLLRLQGENWDIYTHPSSDLILILPKNYPFPKEKLGLKLDLLKKQSTLLPSYVDNSKTKQAEIKNIEEIFDKNSSTQKRIILHGHGFSNTIGALKKENYQQFLELLNQVNTKALLISSCYGGGSNLLHHYAVEGESKEKFTTNFPIVVHSIGSFITYECSEKDFFDGIRDALKKATVKNSKLSEATKGNFINSSAQIYFPTSHGEIQGFRPIHHERIYSLTQLELASKEMEQKKSEEPFALPIIKINPSKEIEQKKNEEPSAPPTIKINPSKEILAIAPLVSNVDIFVRQSNPYVTNTVEYRQAQREILTSPRPLLFSLIPDNSCQLISKITGSTRTLQGFFESQAQFYTKEKCEGQKVFFITEFEGSDKAKNCVFVLNGTEPHLYYKDEFNKYYCIKYQREQSKEQLGVSKPIELSELEYIFTVDLIRKRNTPSKEALQAAGVWQRPEELREALDKQFWGELPASLETYRSYSLLSPEEKIKSEQINKLLASVDKEAFPMVLFAAFSEGEVALAEALLLYSPELEINKKTVNGIPFLSVAIQSGASSLVDLLLQKEKIDLNISDNDGNTPLIYSLKTGEESAQKLLAFENKINFNCKNKLGWNALYYATTDPMRELLVKKYGLGVNELSHLNYTLLSAAVQDNNKELVSLWLKLGADPDTSEPSALERAIANRNLELIDLLLNAPMAVKKPSLDESILENASVSSPAVLEKILQAKKWGEDELEENALFAASMLCFDTFPLFLKQGVALNEELIMQLCSQLPTKSWEVLFNILAEENKKEENLKLMAIMLLLTTSNNAYENFIKKYNIPLIDPLLNEKSLVNTTLQSLGLDFFKIIEKEKGFHFIEELCNLYPQFHQQYLNDRSKRSLSERSSRDKIFAYGSKDLIIKTLEKFPDVIFKNFSMVFIVIEVTKGFAFTEELLTLFPKFHKEYVWDPLLNKKIFALGSKEIIIKTLENFVKDDDEFKRNFEILEEKRGFPFIEELFNASPKFHEKCINNPSIQKIMAKGPRTD